MKDSGFATRKLGTVDFISRLEEALNLLPGSDSQSLGEKVTMALSAGGREPNVKNGSIHGGQQQDLRQQQVWVFRRQKSDTRSSVEPVYVYCIAGIVV